MARPRKPRRNWDELGTIWTVSDESWAVIQPILQELDPPKATGRPRSAARAALDAIIFRMRSGCQWNQLPERFPDDSSIHRTFPRWVRAGIFEHIWAVLIERCEELGGVDWEWQAADGMMGKARLGGPDRPQSHRPWQARRETKPAGGGGWRPTGPGDCRG
jgi:transposase